MITLKIKGLKQVMQTFDGYSRTIPEATRRGLWNLARYAAKAYKDSARARGIKHWGGGFRSMFTDTKPVKLGVYTYGVKMPIHGVAQDRMRPHWVSLKKGRLITKWAKDRGINAKSIFVRPKPYMRTAEINIRARAGHIVGKEVKMAVRRKGR